MPKYNFDLEINVGHYEIRIDSTNNYGYFEHDIYGDTMGGGLWFLNKELTDYDGVFALPTDVMTGIRALGYVVPEEFE